MNVTHDESRACMSEMLKHALSYAARGWPVLALHSLQNGCCTCSKGIKCTNAGKHPRTPRGLKDATTDEAIISLWWGKWCDANIGILTGKASDIVVLDVDPRHGGDESLIELQNKYGSLPDTVEALTGGDGSHFYLRDPRNGTVLPCRTNLAGFQGLDFKANGGYVVAPPSLHISGRPYAWEGSSHPDDVNIAEIPDWFLSLVDGQHPIGSSVEVAQPKILAGKRNSELASLAGRLRRDRLGLRAIESALLAENIERCEPPLQEEEVKTIAASISRYPQGEIPRQTPLSVPTFTENNGVYSFLWDKEGISIELNRFRDDGRTLTAEITANLRDSDYTKLLHQAQFNLRSTGSRRTLAAYLNDRFPDFDWVEALEQICLLTLNHYRSGEPVIQLQVVDKIKAPEYLLHPVILKGYINVIFGEGGVGKGIVVLLLVLIAISGSIKNIFGLIPSPNLPNILYLDWETDNEAIQSVLSRLRAGLNLPLDIGIHYRRCYAPLSDDLPEIRQFVLQHGIDLIIIDSLAAACGGDVNDAGVASKFMARDLPSLQATVVCIAHNSKNLTGMKTVFGSVFFTNYARSVWECKGDREAGDDFLDVGLFCRKVNFSKKFKPIGIRFTFHEGKITAAPIDIKDVAGFEKEMSLHLRIANKLREAPRMTVKALAEVLGKTDGTVRATLNKYAKEPSCWFVNLTKAEGKIGGREGDEWGLRSVPTPEEIINERANRNVTRNKRA